MAQQTEPPDLDHVAPAWFHKWWKDVRAWMIQNRVVQGIGTQVSDASGAGGKRVDALPDRSQTTQMYFIRNGALTRQGIKTAGPPVTIV